MKNFKLLIEFLKIIITKVARTLCEAFDIVEPAG